jgi:hypothetical protein
MSDVEIKIKFQGDEAIKAAKAVNAQLENIENTTKQVNLNLKNGSSFFANFAASLAAVGVQKAIAGFSTFIDVIGDSVKASQESEDSLNQLNNALATSGQYSVEASQDLQKFASELQRTTRFEDDTIISSAALIQTLGNLSKDGLKEATKAATDMAAALGIDLNTAATLVGKAAQGQIETFGRYGVAIRKGATDAETFSNTLTALNAKFGGRAASDVKTFSGSIAQLANQYDDLKETIGAVITQNPFVISVFKSISGIISAVNSKIGENSAILMNVVASGLTTAINAAQALLYTVDAVVKPIGLLFNGLKVSILSFAIETSRILSLVGLSNDDVTSSLQAEWDAVAKSINNSIEKDSGLVEVAQTLENIKLAALDSFNQMKTGAADAGNEIKNGFVAPIAEIPGILALLNQSRVDSATQSASEIALVKQAESDETYRILNEGLGREQAARVLYDAQKLANEGKTAEASIKISEAERTAKDKINKKREEDQKSTYQTIATLASSNNSTLATIGKAAALAQIAISGPEAVVKALAAFPPPFNFVAGAAVAAAVAAQAAQVAGVKFATGGIVPGNSTSGDKVSAQLNSGEMVLNKRQQSELFNMANSGGGSSKEIIVTSNIYLDSDVVARSVSRHVADGLVLGAVT